MTVSVPKQAPSVHYVYIPADLHEEIRELQLEVPPGREVECLLDVLKEFFRHSGGSKTEAQREAHRQHLLSQVGPDAASKMSDEMMSAALNIQMVDTVALLVNTPDSGYVGVNLYCDDQAQFKELPLNLRASQITECCGRPTQVRGDAFLGRMFDNDDAFVRLDLRLSEVSSSAPWVAAAAAQAARRLQQGDRAAQFLEQVQQQRAAATAVAAPKKQPTVKVRELSPAEVEKEAGNAAVKSGDWEGAVARYGAALELDPGLLAAANNRALALLRLGRHQEAEADCSRVLEGEPGNVKALLRRAAASSAQGHTAEAVADLQAVLVLEPHNKEAAAEIAKLAPPPPPPPAPHLEATAIASTRDVEMETGTTAPVLTSAAPAEGSTTAVAEAVAAAATEAGAVAAAAGGEGGVGTAMDADGGEGADAAASSGRATGAVMADKATDATS